MGATGTATLDFGATPRMSIRGRDGQAGIVSGSLVEAFFMRNTTADNVWMSTRHVDLLPGDLR